MRLIDADELLTQMVGMNDGWFDPRPAYDHESLIKIQPTVDAVPIIRCKECKWYDTEYHCKLNGYGCGRSPDWFCADGKKEEE